MLKLLPPPPLHAVQQVAANEQVDMATVEVLGHSHEHFSVIVGSRIYEWEMSDDYTEWHRSGNSPWQYYLSKGYEWITCHECGLRDIPTYDSATRRRMVEENLCFNCLFWLRRLEWSQDPDKSDYRVVIDHHLYSIGTATTPSHLNGFGGTWFYIERFDGVRCKTCDLWHGGRIPRHFRNRFPNNAMFLTAEKWQMQQDGMSALIPQNRHKEN